MQRIIEMGGLSSEWTYSYNSYYGAAFNCKFSNNTPPAAKLQSYVKIPSNTYAPLMQVFYSFFLVPIVMFLTPFLL